MTSDDEHLRLLSIFHYVVAGLAALFSFFSLFYALVGLLMLYDSGHQKNGGPPPHLIGWLLIGFGCFFFLLGLAFAVCIILSGRFIKQHRRYWFSFVVACVECVFIPFGVVLGVFTIIVLSRRSVKELYGIETATTPVWSGAKGTDTR